MHDAKAAATVRTFLSVAFFCDNKVSFMVASAIDLNFVFVIFQQRRRTLLFEFQRVITFCSVELL